jgi:hypothetical protein
MQWKNQVNVLGAAIACLFSFSFQSHADTQVWPSVPWPSKKGSLTVQPFSFNELAAIKKFGYEGTNGQPTSPRLE